MPKGIDTAEKWDPGTNRNYGNGGGGGWVSGGTKSKWTVERKARRLLNPK